MESSSTVQQKLQSPLLGVMPCEVDQEQYIVTADIAAVLVDDVEEQQEEEQKDDSQSCYNLLIIWVVLPLLLFVQFGIRFAAHDETTSNLSWSIVNISILLFCLTVGLYRATCIDTKMNNKSFIVMLLPEIILNAVLILVMLNKTPEAFCTLLLGMELLSSLAIVATVRHRYYSSSRQQLKKRIQSNWRCQKKMTAA
jgi:hypothetical protein